MCLFSADCAHGEGLNMTTKQCVKCPIRQYNNKTGENTNLCKICPAGKTNSKTGQPDCPITGKYISFQLYPPTTFERGVTLLVGLSVGQHKMFLFCSANVFHFS